jgi:hypothetical protein
MLTANHQLWRYTCSELLWGQVNCCWSLPAQSHLVPILSPAGLMTIFYCLTTLGVMQLTLTDWLTDYFSRLGKLLRALSNTVTLGSESCGTHDHILLSHNSGSHASLFFTNCFIQPSLYSLSVDHIENTAPDGSFIITCVSFAAEMCLVCHCFAVAISCCTVLAFSCHVKIWS